MEEFGKSKHQCLSQYLELANGIPSHDIFNRVFQLLDPNSFQDYFIRWT